MLKIKGMWKGTNDFYTVLEYKQEITGSNICCMTLLFVKYSVSQINSFSPVYQYKQWLPDTWRLKFLQHIEILSV